jgi:hypothetical protein
MEKQFNSDLEQAPQERTLISLDGQSPPAEIPYLNLVYEEPGVKFYLANIDGKLSFHSDLKDPATPKQIKHLRHLLDCLVLTLMEKGMEYLDTWIPPENEKQLKFAELFGFYPTGIDWLVQFQRSNGEIMPVTFSELRLQFPKED